MIDPGSSFLVDVALRGSVLWLLAGLAAALLRKAAPAVRQGLWTATIVGVLALPLLTLTLPPLPILPAGASVPPSGEETSFGVQSILPSAGLGSPGRTTATLGAVAVSVPEFDPVGAFVRRHAGELLLASWLLGVVAVVGWLALGLVRLRSIRRRSSAPSTDVDLMAAALRRRLGIGRPVELIVSEEVSGPATWGWRKPTVVLPPACRSWSRERLELVLAHELTHVARHDWIVRVLARLGCALYWFHPVAWLGLTRLRTEQELACDQAVLDLGTRPSTYAQHLLAIAQAAAARRGAAVLDVAALDMARRTPMEGRLMSILSNRSRRPLRSGLLVSALLVVALPVLATVRSEAPEAPRPPQAPRASAPAPAPQASSAVVGEVPEAPVAPASPEAAPVVGPDGIVGPVDLVGPLPAPAVAPSPAPSPQVRPVAPSVPAALAGSPMVAVGDVSVEPSVDLSIAPAPVVAPTPAVAPTPKVAWVQAAVSAPQASPSPEEEPSPVVAPTAPRAPRPDDESMDDDWFDEGWESTYELDEALREKLERLEEVMRPIHEEIEREMESAMQPLLESMEELELEMRPFQEEMSRLGAEMSEIGLRDFHASGAGDAMAAQSAALAEAAMEQARLGAELARAEGEEAEAIRQRMEEVRERLEEQRQEMEVHRQEMQQHMEEHGEEIRARMEEHRVRMEEIRHSLEPHRERMEQLRKELEPVRERIHRIRDERMEEVHDELEQVRREIREERRREIERRRVVRGEADDDGDE